MQGRVGALGMLPGIERKGLAGAVTFTDAVCDDAGLALSLLKGAVEYGAVALNNMRMIDAEADGRRVTFHLSSLPLAVREKSGSL